MGPNKSPVESKVLHNVLRHIEAPAHIDGGRRYGDTCGRPVSRQVVPDPITVEIIFSEIRTFIRGANNVHSRCCHCDSVCLGKIGVIEMVRPDLTAVKVVLVEEQVGRSCVPVPDEPSRVDSRLVRCDCSYSILRTGGSELYRLLYRWLPGDKTERCT